MATKKKETKDAKPKAPKKVKAKATGEFKTVIYQEHKISKKRSGRYEVVNKLGKNVNGAEKAKLLIDAKLVTPSLPSGKAKEEAPSA